MPQKPKESRRTEWFPRARATPKELEVAKKAIKLHGGSAADFYAFVSWKFVKERE